MRIFLFLFAFMAALLTGCSQYTPGHAPSSSDEIGTLDAEVEAQVEQIFNESGIPSMAVAVVVGEDMLWAKGYGEQTDLSTVYMVGSIDKPFLATAFLQMVDEGVLNMDDDINEYLPFEVSNTYAPEVPITLRMLVTH